MGSVLVLMWRDMAATVEVRLTGGQAAMAALVCLQQRFQKGNINSGGGGSCSGGGGALLSWKALALKFLGGGRIG
jgi:uncharacterized membrane protein YgcG